MFDSGLDTEHLFGQGRRMRRTRVRRRRLVVALLATSITIAAPVASRAVTRGADGARSVRYVVRPGDTLWGIAIRTTPGQDPRRVVAAIVQADGVDPGALEPGQVLRIPVSS